MSFSLVAQGQSTCSEAVTATIGTNTRPTTSNRYYWYSYTMPSDGKIKITSTSSSFVEIYSGTCNDLYEEDHDYENITSTLFSSGDEVLIQWDGYHSGNSFEWNLSLTPFEEGDRCTLPATASLGTNTLPITSNDYYWYSYTMPNDGKLEITTDTSSTVTVYSNTCNDLHEEDSGWRNATVYTLSSGDEVFIKWDNRRNGKGFEWDLDVSPITTGEDCLVAATAEVGTNRLPATSEYYYWYNYTMPSAGELSVSAPSSSYVTIYTGSCNDLKVESYGYGSAVTPTLGSGEEVFIRLTASDGGDFDWNLSVPPITTGEDCSIAATAEIGTNILPATSADYYWYTYTMPSDSRLEITTASSSYVTVYTNTCNNLFSNGFGYYNTTVTTLSSGDEVFIQWDTKSNDGDFDWDLSISPLETGDNCSLAATAEIGTNPLPATSVDYYWYTYTMPSDGKLEIMSTSSTYVNVYSNTCNDLNFEEGEYENVTTSTFSGGDKIFIRLETRNNGGDFDWDLSVSSLEAGAVCLSAETAQTGTNNTPTAPYWFKYNAPTTGDYIISSVGTANSNTYLKVYSDCNGTEIASNDDYESLQSQTTFHLTESDVIYILWDDEYSSESFDWTISHKLEQTLTFDALPTKTLESTTFELTATSSSDLPISYSSSNESVATISGNIVTVTGAGTTTITASQDGDDTYNAAAPVEQVLTVTKVDQTITLDAIENQLTNAEPIMVNASVSSGLALDYTVSGPATINDNVITLDGTEGTVTVTVSQMGDDYYTAASASESFSVTYAGLQDQTITFDTIPNKSLKDSVFYLTATATSGLPVSYSSSDGTVATISDSTVTIIGIGTTTITASQEGNDTYQAATPVERILVIHEPTPDQTEVDCTSLNVSIAETIHISCSGASNGVLIASASGGTSPYQYSIDGNNFKTETSFTALDSGNYTITVKDANECMATVVAQITAPQPLMVTGQVNPSTENPGNGRIALNVEGGTTPYSYAWSHNATTDTVADLTSGDYSVTVTDAAGCTSTTSFTVDGVTAIKELQQPEIVIYPNPTQEVLHIDLSARSKVSKVALYDVMGIKIAEEHLVPGKNQLDTHLLKPGTYLLKLDNGHHQRIIVK
uniref:T9SS type A sorting domain-containing protein n=1 Tax=Roseihalotalea indica TaxID=2867963 RepID=A0AA49GSV8_9BACT|nr:T9SS type A sorting domain-containing protein [Tunicatimonas sp. TK19036]